MAKLVEGANDQSCGGGLTIVQVIDVRNVDGGLELRVSVSPPVRLAARARVRVLAEAAVGNGDEFRKAQPSASRQEVAKELRRWRIAGERMIDDGDHIGERPTLAVAVVEKLESGNADSGAVQLI
ncbi:hypothetical protein [Sphingomonas parva]|uniref:hypothetical protein n=1 Tax=Sphingomonas parva TaxID=2555898 RepID=UPI0014307C70|nr:hypothetical protein [Sphingomonas parva]